MQCVFCEVLIQFFYIYNTNVSLHSARSSWLLWTFRVKKNFVLYFQVKETTTTRATEEHDTCWTVG
jgi:hypothetical protein